MFIGIDLGTSGVKLTLIGKDGKVINEVTKSYRVYSPFLGWSEQDPEEWWNCVLTGIKELLNEENKNKLQAISFSGQMHGLIMIDFHGDVIRPCILWNDSRSEKETNYLNECIGKEKLSLYTGNIAFAGFTAPKILWVKNNEFENFERINKVLLPKDYLVYKFTGKYCTDFSDASGTLLLNVKEKKWSEEMCNICSICIDQLPELHESYDVIGYIKQEIAKELNISNNVKIIMGAADNVCAALGTGTIGNGKCNISLGTSGTIFVPNDTFLTPKNNSLHSFNHADGNYYLMGCILSAASCRKWWLEDILNSNDYVNNELEISNLGIDDLLFVPYLNGERCPHNDVNAKGAFINITNATNRSQMSKAVLEGVSFALKNCFDIALKNGLEIKKVTICGGGSKSKIWCQIIADIFNVPVITLKNEYGASYGASLLAMYGCRNGLSLEKMVDKMIEYGNEYYPILDNVTKYKKKYQKFSKCYSLLKELY